MYATYPQNNTYAPQYNGYVPVQQPMQPMQPMAVAAPAAQASTAIMGLLLVAGVAVVGAAAFGGFYLMNSSGQPEPTAASAPSTVVNLPSTIEIPSLTSNSDPASPVIVTNPGPAVRVFTPSAPQSAGASAPVAQAPVTASAPAAGGETKTDPAKTDPAKTGPDTSKTGPATGNTGPEKLPPVDTGLFQ